ncbi:PhzF family phenazine biosynthesis isomerase [Microbacterium sp. 1P10UB]|uniref:PhzF family phenazine biosynthesis protein n=1 Tax=unclassified Microbacterium TaxID=2609290 RepID=UPI0039A038CD
MTAPLRYAAFAAAPGGGNPAGVVLDAAALTDADMQAIAADVGYSETAFVTSQGTDAAARRVRIRYFSPLAEVPFCGHATIATAVALAERRGTGELVFETPVGDVVIATADGERGIEASFTSVEPEVTDLDDTVLDRLLGLLGKTRADLDPRHPPRLSFAGNRHPVVVFAGRAVFDGFTFDPDAVRALMDEQGWAGTVTTLFAVSEAEFDARNLFPVGAITEDPATGSAAASVGAYLRALGLVDSPARVTITQGAHVGRPSVLRVDIPPAGGITVTGTATPIA